MSLVAFFMGRYVFFFTGHGKKRETKSKDYQTRANSFHKLRIKELKNEDVGGREKIAKQENEVEFGCLCKRGEIDREQGRRRAVEVKNYGYNERLIIKRKLLKGQTTQHGKMPAFKV